MAPPQVCPCFWKCLSSVQTGRRWPAAQGEATLGETDRLLYTLLAAVIVPLMVAVSLHSHASAVAFYVLVGLGLIPCVLAICGEDVLIRRALHIQSRRGVAKQAATEAAILALVLALLVLIDYFEYWVL